MTARSKSIARLLAALSLVLASLAIPPRACSADWPSQANGKIFLHDGWQLQSSCKVNAKGGQISVPGFRAEGWHAATVPSTVVAALVADGTFPDPYFGENLRSIPGTTYPIGKMFSVLPMSKDSPFRCSWWYRTEFRLADNPDITHVWLHFGGINNRANIWLNGHRIAGPNDVAGAYRTYEFDVGDLLLRDRTNVLAVETIAPTEHDLGINWVDWNPAPPDKDMGLWRDVYLRATGSVEIDYPQVVTHFDHSAGQWNLDQADLTVEARLRNASQTTVSGTLEAEIEGNTLRQTVALAPGEIRVVGFAPDEFPAVRIRHPKLWWPRQMGTPVLRPLSLRFSIGDRLSDSIETRFGIREITSELDSQSHRLFRVNGKRILIRGGGWVPDMLLRQSPERLNTEFRYIRDLNLNAVRLEGKMETDEFYDLADEQGVLIIAGWCCCDYWEQWGKWKPTDLEIATASLRSQILRMRSHPSMLTWLNGSDNPPPANVERAYIEVLKQSGWPNPYVSSASQTSTTVTGLTGMKMTGPYDYVPPDYWLTDTKKYGGAFGFIAETSTGAAIPPLGCLRRMLRAEDLVPGSPAWNYHAGSERFQNSRHFEDAMDAIYGAPSGIDDYERKAQTMAYDGERAMFEAYSRNKYRSTGIIQWTLNNAWPSLIWHLYDYYLQPAGGYFGAKKACEPIHVQYSYDDRSVAVVNSTYADASQLMVTANLYDSEGKERFSGRARADIEADATAKVLAIPDDAFLPTSPVYFVRLTLENAQSRILSTNFYWLSAKKSVYDWTKGSDPYVPVSSYEDLTALGALPSAGKMGVSADVEGGAEGPLVHVKLENPSDRLAFQIHLGIHRQKEGMEILPVLWEDNYVELMPGESREITARFPTPGTLTGDPELSVTGWNIAPTTLPLGRTATSVSHSSESP
jgi:exo-1,4-beta-D-glucosaminidase